MLTRLRCWLAANVPRKPRTGGAGCADELTFVPESRDRCRARRRKPKPEEGGLPTKTSIDRARSARSLDLRSLVRPPLGMLALLSRGACAAASRRRAAWDSAVSAPAFRQDASRQRVTSAYILCTASNAALSWLCSRDEVRPMTAARQHQVTRRGPRQPHHATCTTRQLGIEARSLARH